MSELLRCTALSKTYQEGALSVPVFKDINLSIKAGETVAIVGSSGAGKSTLLQLMGGLDQPTAGEVLFFGRSLQTCSETEKCRLRNLQLGFIYQFHHLLPEFSALENVCMPLWIAGKRETGPAQAILSQVGLSARVGHRVSELSGGERQRVAIARALVHQPACVLADEPTGNLDHATADSVFALMLDLNRRQKTSFVIVTHNILLAKRCDRLLTLEKGSLIEH